MTGDIIRRVIRFIILTTVIAGLLGVILPAPVKADGIAMSGSFYRHHFKLVPGESMSTPEIYVVVFNKESEDIKVRLTPESPSEVEIYIGETDFPITAGGQHKVEVGVRVTNQAVPGEYVLTITAEVYTEGEGIMIMGAAQQQARLTIMGEAGTVQVNTVTCLGEPFPAEIDLCRKQEKSASSCAYSLTGELEARLVPGDYVIQAFYQDTEVAQEVFSLQADEMKSITVVAPTVFIYGFSAVPNYYEDSGEVAFVNIVYTMNNIYQPLPNMRAALSVSLDGELLEEDEIIALPTLDIGSTEGNYKYVPTQGWQSGTYTFMLDGYTQGKLCITSPEQKLEVSKKPTPEGINSAVIGGVVGGVLVLTVVLVMMLRRRRQ